MDLLRPIFKALVEEGKVSVYLKNFIYTSDFPINDHISQLTMKMEGKVIFRHHRVNL